MRHILDDLLDVTRISHGKIVLKTSTLDVVQIVRQTVDDHRPRLAAQRATLKVDLPSSPVYCDVDPTRLSQAVANLLTNAAKFLGGPGGVTVRLGEHRSAGSAIIEVRDTGIGIDQETLRDIFEPFVQSKQRLDRNEGGLGLGLALVRGLVELHGGRVRASSPGIGQGAEFTIELPLCSPPTYPPPLETPSALAKRRRRVLVIDDYQDALLAIRKMLELDGHDVFTAEDGTSAIALAREIKPELILCDIGLPGMNGYELAHAIRREPTIAGVCLVALTGYGGKEDQRRARESGFNNHLTKPVSRHELKALIEAL